MSHDRVPIRTQQQEHHPIKMARSLVQKEKKKLPNVIVLSRNHDNVFGN